MSITQICLITAVAFFLVSCNKKDDDTKKEPGKFKLSFTAADYQPHHTHQVQMAVIDRTDRTIVAEQQQGVSADGTFFGTFGRILDEGESYYLSYYADTNNNGTCDSPPADHTWTVKVDKVAGDVQLDLSHNFGFSENCHMFNAETLKSSAGTEVLLTGTVALDANITDATDLTAGQSLAGATVFVEGLPDYEAVTDDKGAFTLAISIPSETALLAEPLRLVTWYTQKSDPQATWTIAKARFGKISEISGSSGNIDMGTVSLTRTNRVRATINAANTSAGIPGCFLQIEGFDFQIVSVEASAGVYEIDYLPAATYVLRMNCSGYEVKEYDLAVVAGTSPDKWIDLPPITLKPL